MSLAYLRNEHNIPAYQGLKVRCTLPDGTTTKGSIVSYDYGNPPNIKVRLDGQLPSSRISLHPTKDIHYLGKPRPSAGIEHYSKARLERLAAVDPEKARRLEQEGQGFKPPAPHP